MILVTGATGKNGPEILKRLSGRGERIRAMVHNPKNISTAMHNCALEFVEADFDDPASLRKALNGVQRAFLVTNSSERVEERQLRFVALACESGVKHIVYLSRAACFARFSIALSSLSRCCRRGIARVKSE